MLLGTKAYFCQFGSSNEQSLLFVANVGNIEKYWVVYSLRVRNGEIPTTTKRDEITLADALDAAVAELQATAKAASLASTWPSSSPSTSACVNYFTAEGKCLERALHSCMSSRGPMGWIRDEEWSKSGELRCPHPGVPTKSSLKGLAGT
jgi:hypothetical protein